MLEFEWPWLFSLLPLPLLVRRFMTPVTPHQPAALRVPFLAEFDGLHGKEKNTGVLPLLLALVAWSLGVTAASRPVWTDEAVPLPVSGRDLMLAVDLSQSMEEADFVLNSEMVNRLVAIKAVAGQFIERRTGDRLGLILFGEQAYLQVPLTFDRKSVVALLNEAQIGLAGNATAIGDAIGVAVKRLRDIEANSRVLILLTDGANTAGELDPLKAAELAAKAGLRIHTIGVGADEMMVRNMFGYRRVNPSADLDENTLRAIAEKTGGQYFRARDVEQLEKIYALIDNLEPLPQDARYYRPVQALYYYPLAGSLAAAAILLLVRLSRNRQ